MNNMNDFKTKLYQRYNRRFHCHEEHSFIVFTDQQATNTQNKYFYISKKGEIIPLNTYTTSQWKTQNIISIWDFTDIVYTTLDNIIREDRNIKLNNLIN